uniref:Uncharacterized protein n=1 Tax=Arundo donax TaxID=35708 RepID=A0A0A9CGJ2_ARUDO
MIHLICIGRLVLSAADKVEVDLFLIDPGLMGMLFCIHCLSGHISLERELVQHGPLVEPPQEIFTHCLLGIQIFPCTC